MLQRDYILRLIREFMAALQRVLEKKEITTRREKIREMYNQYVGPYNLYHYATMEEVMLGLQSYNEDERIDRMSMLAELYYAEADTESDPAERDLLLEKAFALFGFIDNNSKVFSVERRGKMAEIKNRLRL